MKGYYSSLFFIEYITPLESKNLEMKTNKIVKKKKALQNDLENNWYGLIPQPN